MVQLLSPALADNTTGSVTGTVVAQTTGAPVAGVTVTFTSPTGKYTAKTDAKGFYSILSLSPDTYEVSFTSVGYAPGTQSGVTVNAGQTSTVALTLQKDFNKIGSVTARTPNSAFQPTQPIDTYNVNKKQIDTILGKADNVSESNLLVALPGASLDSSGYPVLRGGRENEEGFAFEGIDYTDAFTSQFVNSLALNGEGGFSLTPGAGDASVGNAGTGSINISLKRGSRPAFGQLDLEAVSYVFAHQLGTEYGFATPDGRFSAYASFIGRRTQSEYDNASADLLRIGAGQARILQAGNDLVANLIYKFGKDNNQSLQLVYQNQMQNFYTQNAPGIKGYYASGDPTTNYLFGATFGFTPAQIQSIYNWDRYQTAVVQPLSGNGGDRQPNQQFQPNDTYKIQYSNNLNASTFLTIKAYQVGAVTTFDRTQSGFGNTAGEDFLLLQGGERRGATIDITKQLGDKNLVTIGAKNEFLRPNFSYNSPSYGLYSAGAYGMIPDFLPGGYLLGNNPSGTNYLAGSVPRVPNFNTHAAVNRNDAAFYITDKFTATDRLNFTIGLRGDMTNYQYSTATNLDGYINSCGLGYSSGDYLPSATSNFAAGTTCNGVSIAGQPNPAADQFNNGGTAKKNPFVLEPRAAFAFQLTKSDAITGSYGRSVQFAPITDIQSFVDRASYNQFAAIPANPNVGNICGPTGNRPCASYADQLYWANQNLIGGTPITPLKPSTNSNFDASYSHDFGHGFSAKISPFYRRSYDAYALVASQQVINGVPQVNIFGNPILNPAVSTNLGVSRTTGIEFYATKESAFGLSGSIGLTYLNEFSNVVPLSGSEDFFPSIPPASLALGNQYRVGFLSPFNAAIAAAYRTRSGFKINPIIYANRGYPYGNGSVTATTVNGQFLNVKQTNVTSQPALGGSTTATNYVDPQNPGNVFKPNIAATRGTPEGASPGSFLTHPRISTANLDLEWTPLNSRSTFGLLISNVFNQVYGQPSLNARYQPVATGISGLKTGTTASAANTASNAAIGEGNAYGFVNYAPERYGYDPYIMSPTGAPISYRFYYQLNF